MYNQNNQNNPGGLPPLPPFNPSGAPPYNPYTPPKGGNPVPHTIPSYQQPAIPYPRHSPLPPPVTQQFHQAPSQPYTPYPPGNPVPYSAQNPPYRPNYVPPKTESFEERYGGRITIFIGVFLVFLAVIFGLYYTFTLLDNNIIKTVVAYGVGAVFLLLSLVARKRAKNRYFPIGLCSGAIAILFATTVISVFYLEIFTPAIGMVALAVTFLLAVFLSLLYNSQIIAAFAVLGGIFPLIPLTDIRELFWIHIGVYILGITIALALVVMKKDWTIPMFLGGLLTPFAWLFVSDVFPLKYDYVSSGIILAIFMIYSVMMFENDIHRKEKMEIHYYIIYSLMTILTALSAMNSFTSSTNSMTDSVVLGLLALVYLVLYSVFSLKNKKDSVAANFFIIIFSILSLLSISIGLSGVYLFPVIAVLGLFLIILSSLLHQRGIKTIGYIVALFGLSGFLLSDLYILESIVLLDLPVVKIREVLIHLVLTVVLFIAFLFVARENKKQGITLKTRGELSYEIIKNIVIGNFWFFMAGVLAFAVKFVSPKIDTFWYNFGFCLASFIIILLISKSKAYKSALTKFSTFFILCVGSLYLLANINYSDITREYSSNTALMIITILSVLFINVFAIITIYAALNSNIKSSPSKTSLVSVIVSVVALVFMYTAFKNHIPNISGIVLSVVILIVAFTMIILGFKNESKTTRVIGLITSLIVVVKIFFLDLPQIFDYRVNAWQRVAGFAASGIIFILISFTYQHFDSRLKKENITEPTQIPQIPVPVAETVPTTTLEAEGK